MNPPTVELIEKKQKTEFAGMGAAVQALGVLACFIAFPFGIIAGLMLLVIGGRMAIVHVCTDCRGKVEKKARVCLHCGGRFIE